TASPDCFAPLAMTEGMLGPVNEYTIRQHIKIYGHYPRSRNFNLIRLFNLYQHPIMPLKKCGLCSLFEQSLLLPSDFTHNLPFPTWKSFAQKYSHSFFKKVFYCDRFQFPLELRRYALYYSA
ncbi:hypothetical protein KA005_82045, partial [bacterium]|nr:hypothetical protein [bacterium]